MHLSSKGFNDACRIEANTLSHPDDLRGALATIGLARDVAHASPLGTLLKREAMPGTQGSSDMAHCMQDSAVTFRHGACTSTMGRDAMSVVNGNLQVYGIHRLRIADASPAQVSSGNTTARCVVIGERTAEFIRMAQGL